MPVAKRSKVDIYHDVLVLLWQECANYGKASPTRVASRANLSYVRFQKVLEHFLELDMVQKISDGILLTEKGLKSLRELRKANAMLERLGLDF